MCQGPCCRSSLPTWRCSKHAALGLAERVCMLCWCDCTIESMCNKRHSTNAAHSFGELAYVTARLPVELSPSAVPNMGDTEEALTTCHRTTHTQRGAQHRPTAIPCCVLPECLDTLRSGTLPYSDVWSMRYCCSPAGINSPTPAVYMAFSHRACTEAAPASSATSGGARSAPQPVPPSQGSALIPDTSSSACSNRGGA